MKPRNELARRLVRLSVAVAYARVSPMSSTGSPTDLLLLEEVANFARVSTETVRFWIRCGQLPSVRPGRRRMVSRAALEGFLVAGPHEGATEAVTTRASRA